MEYISSSVPVMVEGPWEYVLLLSMAIGLSCCPASIDLEKESWVYHSIYRGDLGNPSGSFSQFQPMHSVSTPRHTAIVYKTATNDSCRDSQLGAELS